ncbi:MAG: hypothetical protein N838_28975 [Thiohalocapsa sp. PB-PSB1]|mgnify:CR=1 FL=1|jgi:hypothetical protein|nr:MAG: hypothetical protein N838_32620 [Thiohalocapsa sp. PB-PSB1]QQO56798.1 MAG: hypothetical protein N838_28975 [Thiohalocapsa sp. PB-PSB1]HCS91883.1 hypothetical protein [Chromatiaceae bacterium]
MFRFLCPIAALAFAANINAATVLGNLDSRTPGDPVLFGSSTSITTLQSKAAAFTVDSTTSLGSVYLALSNFDDQDVFDVFIGSLSGTVITKLVDLVLMAPMRTNSNESQVWQFDPASMFTLSPGTTYALTLTGGGGTAYTWGRVGGSPVTPTGSATFTGYYFSDSLVPSFSPATDPNNTNSFAIIDTIAPVPAPGAIVLLPLGLALIAWRRVRG